MPVRDVTTAEFPAAVTGKEMVLVDFWADWCTPCKRFGPIFTEAAERHPDITFLKVDTEAEYELAEEAGIVSVPTLMAFRDGIVVHNQAGALTSDGLDQVIQAVKEMDMDEVRRHLEDDGD